MKNSASNSTNNASINSKIDSGIFRAIYAHVTMFRGLLVILVLVLSLTSCKYEDVSVRPLANELVGTTWIAHLGTGTSDNLEYIQVLRFTDETDLYFMNYNSNGVILNAADKYTFSYSSEKIQVSNSFRLMNGYRDGNVIRMGAYEYYYVDINGSVSDYLKKAQATAKK